LRFVGNLDFFRGRHKELQPLAIAWPNLGG
jgi:hypothetical protein